MDIFEILKQSGVEINDETRPKIEQAFKDYDEEWQKKVNKTVGVERIKTREKAQKDIFEKFGVSNLDELNAILKKIENNPSPNNENDKSKSNEMLEKMMQKLVELEKKTEEKFQKQSEESKRQQEISQLTKRGFNETEAQKIYNNIKGMQDKESTFEDAIKLAEKDDFYSRNFEVANERLKKGTIDINASNQKNLINDEETEKLKKIFGLEGKK